jgi:hypothetical protein
MGRRGTLVIAAILAAFGIGQWLIISSAVSQRESEQAAAAAREAATIPRRSRDMPVLSVTGPTNPRGCPTILPGETARFSLTALAGGEENTDELVVLVYKDGTPQDQLTFTAPFPEAQTYDFTAGAANFTVLFRARAFYYGSEAEPPYGYEDHEFAVTVDTTTVPAFSNYVCDVANCDPLTYNVSVNVNRGDSWTYRLLSGGVEVPGGTPNEQTITGCSGTATVSGIDGNSVDHIEFTATNANGSTTETFAMSPPVEATATISAEPAGILEGDSVVLSWSASGATSVSIDNGVGTVWTGTIDATPSGTVTVAPTTTTTYTVTAHGVCQDATATVEVYVQAIPRLPSAVISLIAQTGLASAKTATLPESAEVQLIGNDLDRVPHTKTVLCRMNVLEDVRTAHSKRIQCRMDVRAEQRKDILCRFDCRATRVKDILCRMHSFYPDRTHILARNVATGVVTELGVIEGDAAEQALRDVPLSPGTYEIWTEREGVLWKGARKGAVQVVTVADGVPPVTDPLPAVVNLAASVSRGVTTITWDVAHQVPSYGLSFGLWYSATTPVATFVTPTALVQASKRRMSYETIRRQTAAEYVAVALRGADGTLGAAAEIELPWSTSAPTSPVNQTVGG